MKSNALFQGYRFCTLSLSQSMENIGSIFAYKRSYIILYERWVLQLYTVVPTARESLKIKGVKNRANVSVSRKEKSVKT